MVLVLHSFFKVADSCCTTDPFAFKDVMFILQLMFNPILYFFFKTGSLHDLQAVGWKRSAGQN